MNVASYAELSRSIHQQYAGRRAPLEVSIEITRRCPLECLHCYNNLAMGDLEARGRELTKDEHFKLLDDLADMGCLWLLYTGGEIFARKDFLEIYTYAKRKGFLITLFTNGTLITERTADYLRDWPPFAIEITLYGRTKETYETLTGTSGSYERCLHGIDLLRERGLPLKLKTVPTTVNKHEVVAMKEFSEKELHLDFKFDALVNPRIDCSQSPLAVRLSPEEVVTLDLHFPKVAAEYRQMAEREMRYLPAPEDNRTVYSCGGGVNSFAVDPYGNMSICVLSHQQTYDIRSGSVKEGWEQFLLSVRTKERKKISKCVNCRLHSLCSMCPANGELENGDPESPVEFLCEVAHLRAMALGFQVPPHGDCDFCAGGRLHSSVVESTERIVSREVDVSHWVSPQVLLPILNQNWTSSGGCGGCGSSSLR
ncbi:MAG TPA: radical SAM protein [Terriglobales bacterium]|nr:radical SAM protein [Terriglobales bacterium]